MPDILTMSDSEFLQNIDNLPGETPAVVVSEPPVETPVEIAVEPVVENTEVEATEVNEPVVETPGEGVPNVETPAETPAKTPVTPATPVDEIDYKAVYQSLIGTPIKAGGKEIVLKSPEEAKQLIQKGVGFHKAMAELAPQRRILETLKEHDLLDVSKINELIDISKKNPEAIAALVQSAGLEPHQLIPSGDAQKYTPGNHVLPEEAVQFRTSVENIREKGGTEFLTHVIDDWDVASRAEVYKDPTALNTLFEHKQLGIYDKISSEVERRKVLDANVASLPFIHAYLAVGNDMHEKGLLVPQQDQPAPVTPAPVAVPTPVAVKPAVASQSVTPNPAAARAASVRSAPAAATTVPNFLTMSDEEFKKHHMP